MILNLTHKTDNKLHTIVRTFFHAMNHLHGRFIS